jgi:hypothetical protein
MNGFLSFTPVILPVVVGRVMSWVSLLGKNKLNTDRRVSQTGFQRTPLGLTPEILKSIIKKFEIRLKF